MRDNRLAIQAGTRWLTGTPILRRIDASEVAFCSSYDARHRSYDYLYHEIAGYGASALTCLSSWGLSQDARELAYHTANYLCGRLKRSMSDRGIAAVPHSRDLIEERDDPRYWTFDNAMIVQGLLDVYQTSKCGRLLKAAQEIGDWLLTYQLPSGAFRAYLDSATGETRHLGETFEFDEGAHHSKHAIALIKLSQSTGNVRYLEAARALLDWGITLQDDDGAFWANTARKYVFAHAHCYACEGYAYAGLALEDQKYLGHALHGIRWLTSVQNGNGSVSATYKNQSPGGMLDCHATDATSQAARLWGLLAPYDIEWKRRHVTASMVALRFLERMQSWSWRDPNRRGGFSYCLMPGRLIPRVSDRQYAWCTMFALQALREKIRADELF